LLSVLARALLAGLFGGSPVKSITILLILKFASDEVYRMNLAKL
jgi:hypothetical protein